MHKVKTSDDEFILCIDEFNLSLYKKCDPNKKRNTPKSKKIKKEKVVIKEKPKDLMDDYNLIGHYNPIRPNSMLKDILRYKILTNTSNHYIELESYVNAFIKQSNKLIKKFQLIDIINTSNNKSEYELEIASLKKELKSLKHKNTMLINKEKERVDGVLKRCR